MLNKISFSSNIVDQKKKLGKEMSKIAGNWNIIIIMEKRVHFWLNEKKIAQKNVHLLI